MSSYHGKLKAEIEGKIYEFDGDKWTGPPGETLYLLNDSMNYVPQQHYLIDGVARKVLAFARLSESARIYDVEYAELKPLPPGAVD